MKEWIDKVLSVELPIKRDINIKELNRYIDHTNLSPVSTKDDIIKLCDEMLEYNFFSVCVNPVNVKLCKDYIKERGKIATVNSFPLGQNTTYMKIKEAEESIKYGADEIDTVMNIGKLKENDYDYIINEIKSIKEAIGEKILKVIIETCLLTDEEKVIATRLCVEGGADFVKTSTGFSTGGATERDVSILYLAGNGEIKVKASGGIRDYQTAVNMVFAGADRIGASKSVKIIGG